MRVGVGRQSHGVFLVIDAIGRVKKDLRGAEGRDHIGRDVTWPIGRDHAEVHSGRTLLCAADAQAQPNCLERDIFYQRHQSGTAGGGSISDFHHGGIGGFVQRIDERLWLQQVAIAQCQIGIGNIAHRAQRWLKGMRIFSAGDKALYPGIFSRDVARKIREDRGGGHHGEFFSASGIQRSRRGTTSGQQAGAQQRAYGPKPASMGKRTRH